MVPTRSLLLRLDPLIRTARPLEAGRALSSQHLAPNGPSTIVTRWPDRDAHLGADLFDDLVHPEADFALEHLEPNLGCSDDMLAMMKCRATTGRVTHSLRRKPVFD